MLTDHSKLSIAVLSYFVPALLLSIWICHRQGFHRQLGWFYLVLISICRIIGCTIQIIADQKKNEKALTTAATTFNSIGALLLILSMMGLLERVNWGAADYRRIGQGIFNGGHIASWAALVLGVVGSVDQSNRADNALKKTGSTYLRAAAILTLLVFVLLCIVIASSLIRIRLILDGDRLLVYASTTAIPFFIVRITYTMIVAFSPSRGSFGWYTNNVYYLAFMQSLTEFVIVAIFISAGILAPPLKRTEDADKNGAPSNRNGIPLENYAAGGVEYGTTSTEPRHGAV